MFTVRFNPHCLKFLKKLPIENNERIISKIKLLQSEPFPTDTKRVVGVKDKLFRVRVGKYRILYAVNYSSNEIYIAKIDLRENVY